MKAGEDGTTVLEVAMASCVLLTVVAFALAAFTSFQRVERRQDDRTQRTADLRQALQRVTKDTRQAIEIRAGSSADRLEMRTRIDGVEHDVVYALEGGVLGRRIDSGGSRELADGVTGPLFCYDPPACGAAGPDASTPRLVRVTLSAAPPDGSTPLVLATDVHLRNAG